MQACKNAHMGGMCCARLELKIQLISLGTGHVLVLASIVDIKLSIGY